MPHRSFGDHPSIANALATGYPNGAEPEAYRCPLCGKECECVFKHKASGEILGCENCIESIDPYEVECL